MTRLSTSPLESCESSDALELTHEFSRRDFLSLSGLSLLALGLPLHWRRKQLEFLEGPLARILEPVADIYDRPSFNAEKLESHPFDEVLPIEMAVLGGRVPEHNRVWYYIEGRGFLHSSYAQPVFNRPNVGISLADQPARLMDVSVPFVDSYRYPSTSSDFCYRLYYATTHWIKASTQDNLGNLWYRIDDPRISYDYYAPAEAFRPIPEEELEPISSELLPSGKRIEVDIERQWLKCFEGDSLCFMTKVSTGTVFDIGDFSTPRGTFPTRIKRASRHMWVSPAAGGYNLPGVPWVNYFNLLGDALHGVYWHNDYGTPRSHGCVNLTPQAAKWIFRWTNPFVPADIMEVWVDDGTSIRVHS
jgi:hypothetical protein